MAKSPPIPPASRTRKGPGAATDKGIKGKDAKQNRAADHRETSRHTTAHSGKKGA